VQITLPQTKNQKQKPALKQSYAIAPRSPHRRLVGSFYANPQLIHRNPQPIHTVFVRKLSHISKTLYRPVFHGIYEWGKRKKEKIWLLSGKKCYFV
jgi:hypothetical protein